jgi:hypothetical protein
MFELLLQTQAKTIFAGKFEVMSLFMDSSLHLIVLISFVKTYVLDFPTPINLGFTIQCLLLRISIELVLYSQLAQSGTQSPELLILTCLGRSSYLVKLRWDHQEASLTPS